MRPFTASEVAKYVLWVVLGLALTAILAWRLFLATGHKSIETSPGGGSAYLHLEGHPAQPDQIARSADHLAV
jgi:hypothetical protein